MKPVVALAALVVLAACGHQELKAPCGDTASLSVAGCGERIPVNMAARPEAG